MPFKEKKSEESEVAAKLEALRPGIAIASLGDIHRTIKGKDADVPERVSRTDNKIDSMNSLIGRVPQLKSMLGEMKQLERREDSVENVSSMEDTLKEEMREIRDSLSVLRDEISKSSRQSGMESKGLEEQFGKTVDAINARMESASKSMEETFSRLSRKIEKVSESRDVETESNMIELKKQIESIRSELPRFLMKSDLAVLAGAKDKPKEVKSEEKEKQASTAAKKGKVEEFTRISALEKNIGKEVVVDCRLELFKKLEEQDMKLYWYKARDDSGECILTSRKEIKKNKAVVLCKVNKTGSGSVYLKFIKDV